MARRSASSSVSSSARVRAVAYIRVSTDKQAEEGVSLDAQQAKVRGYAALYNLDLTAVIVTSESAKSLDRPDLTRALDMLKTGKADALLVVKLDRLTRSVRDLGTLIESHFQRSALLSVSESIDTRSAGGRLVLNVLASVSQWEREAIGERTSEAMQYKASVNEFTGGEPPYGYRVAADGVHLDEHEGEQAVIRHARELRGAGLSLRAVAAELERAGFLSRKGHAFAAPQIMRMVA